ncbi:F-box domain-containing protein [Coniochaeta sp. PMI_546]|nr:F-box domain-containing protein [Coniochaeta sp. PMI_546]
MEDTSFSTALAQRSWPSLKDLSTELLMIIFEQLLEIDHRAAVNARLVSRRLNDIATPLLYRTTSLNANIACREAEIRYPQALLNIFMYANHLILPSNLDPYWARRILDRTENLRQITWRYVKINQWEKWSFRPCHVLDMEIVRQNRLKVNIEDLPLDVCGGDLQKLYIQSIPPDSLVSLKLGIPTPPLSTQLQALKELLVQAHNLETLHYRDRGQGTHFTFDGTERLPAFKELRLESYDWNHDSREVEDHWDFSQLESLSLVSMPTWPFLSSVSFPDLANLQTLQVEDFSLHHSYRREEATDLLHTLVKDHIRAPTTLDLRVHTARFPIDAITTHAGSLQVLRLRDHTGFGDENLRCPTMSIDELTCLSRRMTHLHTLEIDMDTHLVSTNLFLRALCDFPKLRSLTLHVHTLVNPHDTTTTPPNSPDRDREFAHRIFWFLVHQAARSSAAGPWRDITVNVGGWQRTMVRRLGEAWKGLNRRGIFAERCFILRRVDGGEYRTGEEFGGGLFMGSLGEGAAVDVDMDDSGRDY